MKNCSTSIIARFEKKMKPSSPFLNSVRKLNKRWSEAESFTIFENHVYISLKNLMFAQIFCLFWSQNWRTFYHLLDVKCCPNVLPFLEPKLEDLLSLTTREVLPKCFAFFEAKIGGLSIPYGLHMKSCPIFLPFLEPKLEDLKLFEVGCPNLSWVSVLHVLG